MVQNTMLEAEPTQGKSFHSHGISSQHYNKLQHNPAQAFRDYGGHPAPSWNLNRLEFVRMIGRGYASRVWQCTDTLTGATVAVKVYHKSDLCPLNHHQIHREAVIHSAICHPNVLPFLGTFSDPENVYMVLQFCHKGDLYSYLKQKGRALSENQAAKYVVVPFLSTLAHLHASGIIHRDIKPENILVTDSGSLQLADFGLSIRSENDAPVTRVGTLDYMAPEVVNCPRKRNPQDWKHRTDLHYTAAVDVWALGVLVYELCLGEPPFSGENKEAVQQAIQHNTPDCSQLSDACAEFVRLCLCKDARQRPTAHQLQTHPWLRPYSTPTAARSISVRPPTRTPPNGIQTVLAPRRPPTPPTPVSGPLPPALQFMAAPYGAVSTGVSAPIAFIPGLPIASLQSQFTDGPSSHCKHASMHAHSTADGVGSHMSTMNTCSSSPGISGSMSGLKGEPSNFYAAHASSALDTNSKSLAMGPQGSYASSSCMSTMFGQGHLHAEHSSAPMDTKVPHNLVRQSSEHTYMNAMHAHDSRSTLSRETSALDNTFSSLSQTALPPLHAPYAYTYTSTGPDAYT